jgi:hypothetical protein
MPGRNLRLPQEQQSSYTERCPFSTLNDTLNGLPTRFLKSKEMKSMNAYVRSVFSSVLTLVALSTLLSACASAPRSIESDKGVKKVAVVSMLQENAPIVHVGLTVFNNDRTTVDQRGELNRLATQVVEQRLHAARPEWTIVPVQSNETLAKKSASGTPWFSFTGNVKEDLQRIAHDTDADLVFAVVDTTQENSPGRGVGIWMRALSKDSPGTALVHAHVLLVLVDKNGTEITNRGGSNASVPATELGLNYDLSSLKDPQVHQRVSDAMRKQLETALTAAAKHMGY